METWFDKRAAANRAPDEPDRAPEVESEDTAAETRPAESYTSRELKSALQELLKYGAIEAEKKPNIYRTLATRHAAVNGMLEPLDLLLRIDEVRGLAFLTVAAELFGEEENEWSHPLVRRQRLTLEQSLLAAILRQHYVAYEQEAGVGAGDARVALDELLPQLQVYLGDSGSDLKEQKRLRTLLEGLRGHGIVSEIDESAQQVSIRPLITHVANPESLQNLLDHFRKLAGNAKGSDE
jgi:hypothetical protein